MVTMWACLPKTVSPRVECWEWHSSHNWMPKLKTWNASPANCSKYSNIPNWHSHWLQLVRQKQQPTGGLTLQVLTDGDTGRHTHRKWHRGSEMLEQDNLLLPTSAWHLHQACICNCTQPKLIQIAMIWEQRQYHRNHYKIHHHSNIRQVIGASLSALLGEVPLAMYVCCHATFPGCFCITLYCRQFFAISSSCCMHHG